MPDPKLSSDRLRLAPTALLLIAAVFAAYAPALRAGFIWDDEAHVTAPSLRSPAGLARIWTDIGATQQYYPLLHTAFWLEHLAWDSNPLGYHLTTIALHAISALLFILLLRRLAIPGAWFAGFVFALHPVHVESVAWISEQKNTLSAVFYLGAALAYLSFDLTRKASTYALAGTLFVLALLTKTVTATLPAALLVVLWWQRGHLAWRRDILPLLPWIIIGGAAGVLTATLERTQIGATGAAFEFTLLQRLLLAGHVPWFYVSKLLWPANLTFIYPRWSIEAADPSTWLPLLAALSLLVTCFLIRHRSRTPLAVALLFGGTLFPVLGFFNVYPFQYSFVADHFQYLASLFLIALGAASVARARFRWLALPLVGALAVQTWQQSHGYHDNPTLFRHTLARNPDCWMAHNNLARELIATKTTLPDALTHLQRALALKPNYPEASNNLGLALTKLGRAAEAVPHLESAIRLKPRLHEAHNNLGIALASSGRPQESLAAFATAVTLRPEIPNIQENWGKALLLLGRREEAAKHFAEAERLRRLAAGSAP